MLLVKLDIVCSAQEHAHFVVVHLTKLVKIQARDDAHLLAEIALCVKILAETGAHIGQLAKPINLGRLQFAFSIHNPDIDLEPIFVGQQFFDSII